MSSFNSRSIRNHLKTCQPGLELVETCVHCEKNFKSKFLLKRHIENVHEASRIHQCVLCDFKGKRREHLEDHLKTHSEQRISCDKCDYKTRKREDLARHRCRPKPFSCNLCDLKCATEDALRKHFKVFVT